MDVFLELASEDSGVDSVLEKLKLKKEWLRA
jgi:hypothetical protein